LPQQSVIAIMSISVGCSVSNMDALPAR